MQRSNVDRAKVEQIKAEIREALTSPLTKEELARARVEVEEDRERSRLAHEALQRTQPGAVKTRIFTSRRQPKS